MTRNPYEVLGVAKNASDDEIKKAYRKLARAVPPGPQSRRRRRRGAVQGGAGRVRRALRPGEAQGVRHVRHRRRARRSPGPERTWAACASRSSTSATSATSSAGCSAAAAARQRAGSRATRATTSRRACGSRSRTRSKGVQVRVPVEVETACSVCHGTGAEPGNVADHCPQCGGRGVVSDSQGLFAFSQPCPRCRGNGAIVEKPCKHCRGTGRERVDEALRREDPGRSEGRDARPAQGQGRGRAATAGPAGDLFVVVDVEPSPLYERRGSDLVLDVPVTYAEAALGAIVEIPTPDGPVSLKVPSGTESGKLLRVKGRGAPHLKGGGRGDLLARVKVTVPKKLSKAERKRSRATRRCRGRTRETHAVVREPASPGSSTDWRSRRGRIAASGRARRGYTDRSPLHDPCRSSSACIRRRCACTRRRGSSVPARTPGGTRLYSDSDVERLRLIQRLTTELGLNLAGVEHVLRLAGRAQPAAGAHGAARARAAGRDRGDPPLVQARGRRSTGRAAPGARGD